MIAETFHCLKPHFWATKDFFSPHIPGSRDSRPSMGNIRLLDSPLQSSEFCGQDSWHHSSGRSGTQTHSPLSMSLKLAAVTISFPIPQLPCGQRAQGLHERTRSLAWRMRQSLDSSPHPAWVQCQTWPAPVHANNGHEELALQDTDMGISQLRTGWQQEKLPRSSAHC